MNNCWSHLFLWLWENQPGLILILTCQVAAILHVGYIVCESDGIFYKDTIDADQSEAKKAAVRHDVRRAIYYDAQYQKIPVNQWVIDRQGRDVLWAHYHRGTRTSAIWTTITLVFVTLLFWKFWAKATWVEYFALLFRGTPSFIKLFFGFRPSGL